MSDRADWLPPGKSAAVCFSVDDVHPSTSADLYEAGGDLGRGALGHVARLLERHPKLRVTLFVTPDWRPAALVRTRGLLTRIPLLRDHVHWASTWPTSRFRVDRFPGFVDYLNRLPRTEVGVHGLHHSHVGPRLAVEFQNQTQHQCQNALREALAIFERAGLRHVRGFQPPGWNLPEPLRRAIGDLSFRFVSSARDLRSAITPEARTAMSGLQGVSLIRPEWIEDGKLLHFPSNFQATSAPERAFQILDCGGLLSIKSHIFKQGGGHTMLDGLDAAYVNYLDLLFTTLEQRYGEALWWTSMGEMAGGGEAC